MQFDIQTAAVLAQSMAEKRKNDNVYIFFSFLAPPCKGYHKRSTVLFIIGYPLKTWVIVLFKIRLQYQSRYAITVEKNIKYIWKNSLKLIYDGIFKVLCLTFVN